MPISTSDPGFFTLLEEASRSSWGRSHSKLMRSLKTEVDSSIRFFQRIQSTKTSPADPQKIQIVALARSAIFQRCTILSEELLSFAVPTQNDLVAVLGSWVDHPDYPSGTWSSLNEEHGAPRSYLQYVQSRIQTAVLLHDLNLEIAADVAVIAPARPAASFSRDIGPTFA